MTFTAVVTAHAQSPTKILGNLMYQTRKPDEILCFVSDVGGIRKLREHFPGVVFIECENRNDWGHDKRAAGVLAASKDALGFFNADDSYAMTYVEQMMAALESGAEAAYCAWNTIPGCGFHLGSSTSGNFVVRTDLARRAGYRDRHYEADGTFIEALRSHASSVARVDDLLYFHNVQ